MQKGFIVASLLAAGLAGCGSITPTEHRNYKEMDPNAGLFSETFQWHWVRKDQVPAEAAPAASMSAADQAEFKKWQESAGSTERREFEEWRAWQEWKKKNPK